MKKQPSAGAAADADLRYVRRALLAGLTGSSTDRWLEAPPQLFLTLNGEENGRRLPAPAFRSARIRAGLVVTGSSSARCLSGSEPTPRRLGGAFWRSGSPPPSFLCPAGR